ncbi:MAG: polysaccharide deacetylase family protein [Bacillota bacterium]
MPLVIGYHRVVEDFRVHSGGYMPSMLISVATLEKHLDWIGQQYAYADPDQMDRWLRGDRAGGKPVALISFDDGYRDVYELAFPLLKRKGIPAVVFVVTDLVGSSRLQIHDELYLLLARAVSAWRDPRRQLRAVLNEAQASPPAGLDAGSVDPRVLMRTLFGTLGQAELLRIIRVLRRQVELPESTVVELRSMDWSMLAEMRRAGIRTGSHTCSHALLTNESAGRVAEELEGSMREITEHLGEAPLHLAYPDGRFDAAVASAAAGAGYRFGYTTCAHRDPAHPQLTVPRRLLWENACLDAFGRFSPSVMSCQVNGVFDFAARCGLHHAA